MVIQNAQIIVFCILSFFLQDFDFFVNLFTNNFFLLRLLVLDLIIKNLYLKNQFFS